MTLESSSETVFQTEWFSIEREYYPAARAMNGKPFYRIKAPDGVLMMAVTEEGELILVRQYRPAIRQHTLEFPSGAVDPGETPEQSAARELYEETGYRCSELRELGQGRVMLNRLDSREYAFLGTGARKDPDFQATEDIEVILATPDKLRDIVTSGQFEQFAALGLVVLAEWRMGARFA